MAFRILVVDDEPDVAASARDLLESLPGASVKTAATYREGRDLATNQRWDIVMADEWLPDGRGVMLLAELQQAQPHTIRVLMSAHHDFQVLLRGVNQAAIHRYFEKPWDPLELLRWLTRKLEDRDRGSIQRIPPAAGPLQRP